MEATNVRLTIPDSLDPSKIMGTYDSFLRIIEAAFDASITVRGNSITIISDAATANQVTNVFSRLITLATSGVDISAQDVELLVGQAAHGARFEDITPDDVLLSYKGKVIRGKTEGQKRYIRSMLENTITFGIGPAGTGKTYLAMARAIAALKRREVSRIVLTRPVVEAGESLGFLPGTLEEKLDPYVRPLYDALFDMCEREKANDMIEEGVIEIAPLAFMRGRTLNDAFVILDEAQNTTPDQMKMFLTRLGFHSTFVITGDTSQRDLLGTNGLEHARARLKDVDDIDFVDLGRNDIVRHSLVAKIVDAYEADSSK